MSKTIPPNDPMKEQTYKVFNKMLLSSYCLQDLSKMFSASCITMVDLDIKNRGQYTDTNYIITKNEAHRFCIFRMEGNVKCVAVHDNDEMPVTYASEREAQIETLDVLEDHIDQFRKGHREYDEIDFQIDEFIEPVRVTPEGIIDTDGAHYGKRT